MRRQSIVAISSKIVLVFNENEASFLFRNTAVHPGSSHSRHLERPRRWPKSWKLLVAKTHRLSFCLIVCFCFVCLLCQYRWRRASWEAVIGPLKAGCVRRQLAAQLSGHERPVLVGVGHLKLFWRKCGKQKQYLTQNGCLLDSAVL